MPTKYPPIADHGLIGDLQTAALVATDGHHRLVLLPPLRLAERVRVAARRPEGRPLRVRTGRQRPRHEADVPARHRDPRHAVPVARRASPRSSTSCRSRTRAWSPTATAWSGLSGASAARSSSRPESSRASTTGASRTRRSVNGTSAVFETRVADASTSRAPRRSSATATTSGPDSPSSAGRVGGHGARVRRRRRSDRRSATAS